MEDIRDYSCDTLWVYLKTLKQDELIDIIATIYCKGDYEHVLKIVNEHLKSSGYLERLANR